MILEDFSIAQGSLNFLSFLNALKKFILKLQIVFYTFLHISLHSVHKWTNIKEPMCRKPATPLISLARSDGYT